MSKKEITDGNQKIFHKAIVYSLIHNLQKNKNEAIKHIGWSDNTYEYYQNEDNKIWHLIDPDTGLALMSGDRKIKLYVQVHTEEYQNKFKARKQTDTYNKLKKEWEQKLAEAKDMDDDWD